METEGSLIPGSRGFSLTLAAKNVLPIKYNMKNIMNTSHIFTSLIALLFSTTLFAQPTETTGSVPPGTRVFKVYNNPSQEKTDQFDITGFGGTTFTASNTADGTTNSFNHNVQVIVGLTSAKAGSNFQLNFYSSPNNIQQA